MDPDPRIRFWEYGSGSEQTPFFSEFFSVKGIKLIMMFLVVVIYELVIVLCILNKICDFFKKNYTFLIDFYVC